MKDLIEKDADVAKIKKEIRLLDKKRRALNKKLGFKVEKIISSNLVLAISKHKWRVTDREIFIPGEESLGNYKSSLSSFRKSFSLTFEVLIEDSESGTIPIISRHQAMPAKFRIRLNKKSMMTKRRFPSSIKSFGDLYDLSDRWEVYSVRWKNVTLSLNSGSFKIESESSMDDVYSAVKELNIPMDLRSHIIQIEDLEQDLKRRKDLLSDLSGKMLFGV